MGIIVNNQVERYLPQNLPTYVTSAVISDAIEGSQAYLTSRISPKTVSGDNKLDALIVSLLAAVEVRDQITGLGDAFGSRTKAIEDRAEKMIESRLLKPDSSDDINALPVGSGGRAGAGAAVYPIFEVVRPKTDQYKDVEADDQIRPGLIR